jgi:hypothetical protein
MSETKTDVTEMTYRELWRDAWSALAGALLRLTELNELNWNGYARPRQEEGQVFGQVDLRITVSSDDVGSASGPPHGQSAELPIFAVSALKGQLSGPGVFIKVGEDIARPLCNAVSEQLLRAGGSFDMPSLAQALKPGELNENVTTAAESEQPNLPCALATLWRLGRGHRSYRDSDGNIVIKVDDTFTTYTRHGKYLREVKTGEAIEDKMEHLIDQSADSLLAVIPEADQQDFILHGNDKQINELIRSIHMRVIVKLQKRARIEDPLPF